MCERGRTPFMRHMLAVLFHPVKFKQTIIYQHKLLRWESLIDGTA